MTAVGGACPIGAGDGQSVVGYDDRPAETADSGRNGAVHHRRDKHGQGGVAEREESSIAATRRWFRRRPRTAGAVDNGSLVWNIDTLLAGQVARLVIEYTCQAASAKAYNRVAVTLPDGGHAEGEASVEILKPEKPPAPAVPRQLLRQPTRGRRGVVAVGRRAVQPGASRQRIDVRNSSDQQGNRPLSAGRRHGKSAGGHDARRAGHCRGEDRRPGDRFDPAAELPPAKH